MNKIPNHTALKEWSTVVAALGRGEQVILIRKGGIADPAFGVEADRFYLYPTYFHQGESEARPSATITHWCEVLQTWTVRDRDVLQRLHPLVALDAMPRETLEARYRFRPDQALSIIALRTWQLPTPAEVRYRDEYGGCRSWISLDDEIALDGSTPVLTEAELRSKLETVESAVGSLQSTGA